VSAQRATSIEHLIYDKRQHRIARSDHGAGWTSDTATAIHGRCGARHLFHCWRYGGVAIAMTAAHCLEEAAKHDLPDRVTSAPGSPFQLYRPQRVWNRIELGTVLRHRELPPFMSLPVDIEEAYSSGATDIAFLLVTPSEEYRASIQLDRALGLFSAGPMKGERVLVVGFFETEVDTSHHRESDGRAAFQVTRGKFQAVQATVIAVYPDGVRDLNWPCFQLDCPLYSGMSGGCVLVHRGDELLAAGVVSRDLSLSAQASGAEAFAAIIRPALGTELPEKQYQRKEQAQATTIRSIIDLVRVGAIRDVSL